MTSSKVRSDNTAHALLRAGQEGDRRTIGLVDIGVTSRVADSDVKSLRCMVRSRATDDGMADLRKMEMECSNTFNGPEVLQELGISTLVK